MSHRIVIIGAGAAGIAAGMRLRERGVQPLILEARSRVGGRAFTDSSTLGVPVDMGAGWLHSADVNPWTTYARTHGFDVIERDPVWRRRIGARLTTPEEHAAWMAAWERNEALIAASVKAGRDLAVSEVVPNDEFRPIWDAVMTWLMGSESEQVSCLDFDRYEDTNRNWPVRQGLGAVIAHGARELDVRLGTKVTAIDWSRPNLVIETARGAIECDQVIITVPTTVLASDAIRFTPPLPDAYREAFVGIPLGVANKVFFTMEEGALPYEGTTNFIGTDETSRTGSYAVRPNGSDVLLAYFGGSLARDLEMRGELEVFARDELKSIFGTDFIRKIRASLSSSWVSDPFSMGSYSAALPGKAHLREELNKPVADRIYFAGEASSVNHFGTVHGAWHSAAEAAGRILSDAK
jgi:monoamine oxidase